MSLKDAIHPNKFEPLVDLACMLPGIQQGIGVCGALLSIIKLTGNVAKRVFMECAYASKKNLSEEQISKRNTFRKFNNESRKEHLQFLALNIVRCVPVAGSLVSYFRFIEGIVDGVVTPGRTS
jgi:hypothetical protein